MFVLTSATQDVSLSEEQNAGEVVGNQNTVIIFLSLPGLWFPVMIYNIVLSAVAFLWLIYWGNSALDDVLTQPFPMQVSVDMIVCVLIPHGCFLSNMFCVC